MDGDGRRRTEWVCLDALMPYRLDLDALSPYRRAGNPHPRASTLSNGVDGVIVKFMHEIAKQKLA